jgi:hypothetical protein
MWRGRTAGRRGSTPGVPGSRGGSYDEEALLQQVLETSKADEDERFPDLQEALTLIGMVAQHLALLPPPRPLPPHRRSWRRTRGRRCRRRPAFRAAGVTTRTEWS